MQAMALDVRTLYFAVFLIALVLGIAQLLLSTSRRFDSWVAWWGGGNIVGGFGVLALALHGQLPDYISIALANALVVSSYLLIMIGIENFAGVQSDRSIYLVAVGLLFAVLAVPSPISHSFAARGVLIAACDILMNARIVLILIRLMRQERLRAAYLVCALFGFSLLLFLLRMAQVVGGATLGEIFSNSIGNTVLTLCWVIAVPGWNMGLMLMATERMRNDLLRLAHQDPLTGVLNRGGMLAALEPMLADRQERYLPLTLLLVDLDYFKQVNDAYGHAAGDVVLKIFAQTARTHLRPTDVLARQGGDEFAILLPALSKQIGCQIAERLREEFAEVASGQFFGSKVTLTIGVSTSTKPCTVDALFSAADKSLYSAKQGGRNRVLWLPGCGP